MSNQPNQDELLERLQNMQHWKKSKAYYANYLGITESEVDDLYKQLKRKEKEEEDIEEQIAVEHVPSNQKVLVEKEVDQEKGSMKMTASWDREPLSPQEIETQHKIDTTRWELSSFRSKWNGKSWTISTYFKAKDIDTDLTKQKDYLLAELKQVAKTVTVSDARLAKTLRRENLLEISIFDPHFGKLAWAGETGEDYDIDIAEKRYTEAIDSLINRVNLNNIVRIHLPIGNDLFHIDSSENTTTAGTPQDSDSRFAKMVQRVKKLMITTIERLAEHALVDVTIISGNHDTQSTFMLGEILDAYFYKDDRVIINNSPRQRKFYQFGNNGFMYTHGNQEKLADLPIIFATEEPTLWAATKHRFAKVGHFHSNKRVDYVSIEDKKGCQVQILPSLSGTDEWHYSKGYLSNKQAKAFLYHPTEGEIANYTYNV